MNTEQTEQTKIIVVVEAPKPIVEEPEQFCCSCGKRDIWYNLGDKDTPMCKCNPDYEGDDESESESEDETPCCAFCGQDAGEDAIEHSKWEDLWFCNKSCLKKYE